MEFLLYLPVLLFSVVIHEYAHGYVALKEGDNTAYMLGRLTLNPLPHLDPIGSILVPLVLWISGAGFLIGWARPVPVNPRNFRKYRRGDIRVSLAGIVSNLGLAAIFTVAAVLILYLQMLIPAAAETLQLLASMARFGIFINLILAFFNLIPIPPLDGSHVLYHLLPPRLGMRYREIGRFGMLILIGMMVLTPWLLGLLLWPAFALNGVAEALIRLWT